MGEVVNFKSNHAYGELKSRLVGAAPPSRKDAQNTFLTLKEFLESKFNGTKKKMNSVDAVAIGLRNGIDPDLLISVKKSADQVIIAKTGQVLYGERRSDLFGWSTDMSEDGLHLAVGSIFNDDGGTNSGSIRVYSRGSEEDAWVQKGVDIDGEAAQDYSGWSISLSSDGTRLVVGAVFNDNGSTINSGHVRVYDWNSGASRWDQLGPDLNGVSAGDFFGYSISLSKNKNYLAVGAPYGLDTRGYVRVYYWNESNWVQVGPDLEGGVLESGDYSYEYFGKSVALSEDGSRLVVSAPHYYSKTGRVNLYNVDQGSNSINLLDSKVGSAFLSSFGNSLDLKSNIVALSETGYNLPKIITYDISSDKFVEQSNNTISLVNPFDVHVKLSYDGNHLIYGMSGFNSDSGVIKSGVMLGMRGHVKVFKRHNDRWIQNGWKMNPIGGGKTDEFGKSVSISGDGGIICISAPRKDVPSSDIGCVTTYTVKPISHYVTPTITLNFLNPYPLQANTTYVEPGAVTDTGADITITGGVGDSTIEGAQYDILYTSQDGFGNVVTKTRTVKITKDPAIPVMVLNGDATVLVKVNGIFNDPGVTTSVLSTVITDNSALNLTKLGVYEVKYTAVSSYGINSSQIIDRTVVVVNDIDFTGSALPGKIACMSTDGYMVGIGDFTDDTVVFNHWDWDPLVNDWKQIGQKIQGVTGSSFGGALALSDDGLTVAIGAPTFNLTGLVRVYEYKFHVNKWVQKGGDIIEGVEGDAIGEFVTISGDGSVVSCGASQPTGVKNPYIFTYKYTSSSSTWVKIHEYAEPTSLGNSIEKKKFSCALNNDGSLVLVGSPMNNYTTGAVFVYDTSDASLKFSVLGAAVGNYLGESVNFSANARRIVIGDVGGACVKIYNQDEVTNDWNQLGNKIYGGGSSVNLSKNGDIVTFSTPATQGYGKVYQYKWDGLFWFPIIEEFSDNGNGTSFGRRVFVTEDASSILVESTITNQLYRWNAERPLFTLNGNGIVRAGVDQVYDYDYVTTSSKLVISGEVDTGVTNEYLIKYTMIRNPTDVVYQVVSTSGELLQLGLTLQSFATSTTPNKFGWSASISGDGNYLVVGMPGYDSDRGMAKIYHLNLIDVTWDEMISLTGPNVGGSYGYSVSISKDGSRVAIGAPNFGEGMVEVYEYTTTWNLIGSQISGGETGNTFGWSVSLSGSGEYLTVGEPRKSLQVNTGVGGVQTYRYISSEWVKQTSLSFENTQVEHQIGYDAVISSSNNVVLFGAPTAGPGYIKISSYLDGNVPIFATPMTFGERFGWCVSISDDGTIFAVGAPFFNAKRGRVLIYDATTTPPSLKGSPIIGANENDELGGSLHLSGNGQKLLLYSKQGRVSNYQYVGSEWVVNSDEILTSKVTDSNFGYSLSTSTTGNRMVISSPFFENSSGMVQIFSTETLQISNSDFIPPVITLNSENSIVHKKDTTFNDTGVTRDDGEVSFDVTGAVDSSVFGSYTLVYSATDAAGNVSNPLSRIVNVKDSTILNQLSTFPAPVRSRNRNTAIAEKRVALCTPAIKVYDVSNEVNPAVYNQVAQVLPDGDQVGLSQDGTKLYITKFIDTTSGKLSVYSLGEVGFVYAQTPFSNVVTSVDFVTRANYSSTRQSLDRRSNLFGTGVVPYGEQYRQSFKFKNLAMSNDGENFAIGKPKIGYPNTASVSVYKFSSVTSENDIFTQIGSTTSRSFIESLAVSEVGDRLITQEGDRVLIYNRYDFFPGWNLEFEHTDTIQGKVAMSHDGNVAAFVISPSLNVDPITLTGDSTIVHVKGQTFTDPGFSYSGAGAVIVTGTVDTDSVGEYIITYESSNNKQVRIVRVNDSPTLSTFNGSYSTTNIPYGPNFAGWTGTWRNQDFPLFTVPAGFVQPANPEFELSITLNGTIPVAGNWQYMSIQIYTDNGFSTGISFTSSGSGQGESYSYYGGTIYTNKINTKTTIDSGSLSGGDQVRGRLHLYNTFFSTFHVDVTTTISTPTTTPVPIPTVTLIGFPQNSIDTGENFVDPGVTSNNSTDVISLIDAPTFPQASSSIQAIIYRAVNTTGVSGYAVRYVNISDVEKIVIYGRSGSTWSQVANSISTPASLETFSFKHISLSNNGNRLVFSKHDKNIIYDLDQDNYPVVWIKTGEITRDAVCIKMSGDGNRIVIGDSIGQVYLYEYSNGVWDLEITIYHDSSLTGNAGDYQTASIDISKGGEYIIAGYESSSPSRGVTVYTIDGLKRGPTIHSSSVVADKVSISSDGTKLLTKKLSSGLIKFAYYEYNSESISWIEHGPSVYQGTTNLLDLSLSGNGNNLLLLYADRFITNTPAKQTIEVGWEKVGSDIVRSAIFQLPNDTNPPPSTPGARSTPGGILHPSQLYYDLEEIGHVVEISDDGLTVAIGLPFLAMGTGSTIVAIGAAVVFTWGGSDWVQLGGLIVPKYTNNASLSLKQNMKAESHMYSGASISLSGDGQYLCVGSPGYHPDEADKDIYGTREERINSLPSTHGATSWTLYKRDATYAPTNDHYSVGWEPIHTKYSEMSTSLASISTLVPKRELIGHNVKVSSDGSFVVYDTRTDGIKIEAFDSTTNTWGTSQHIPNGVTTYLNNIEYTSGGTTYTYPIHYLGKNPTGDDYVEDWDASGTVGKGGYVARMWPHSYISLSSNDKFLTVSEPEVTLPTTISTDGTTLFTPVWTTPNRSARVNVYTRNYGGSWSLRGSKIDSTSIPHFASSYSSISDDGKILVVPSKDDFSKFHTYDYDIYNDSWTTSTTPQNIDTTNDSGSLTTAELQNFTAAAQSITLASGDGTKVASLYFGDQVVNSSGFPQFRLYTIGSLSTSARWNQCGGNINLSSAGGINTLDSVYTVSEKIITPSVSISNDATKLAVGLANDNVVKVFNYSNDTWVEVASLTNTGHFGDQVVLTRDGNSLAVSAPGNTYGEVFLYDTSTSSVTSKADTLQNTSLHSNGNFGYSLGLSDDCTRLFIGDPDYSNDVSDTTRDTGRVVIKEYDASGTLGFSSGTEIEITRGGALQVAIDKHTRFGESLDVSGDGTRLIASRFGLLDTTFTGDPYTGLEISELWDRDSQTGNWSKKDLQPIVPIVVNSISSGNSEQYYQSPIVKISDSGDFFFYGVSEPSNTSYGSNVALTTTQQYFSPILTLTGASTVEIILGSPYAELGCTSDNSNDTIVITNNIDNTVLGVYTVRYTTTRFGLSNFIERKVSIITPDTAPTITLIGDSVINITQPDVYNEPNPAATAVGGILETYGSPPDGSTSGTFTMRYVVRNPLGTATVERTITVSPDITPPVITPWGGNITHKFNTTYNDPSYIGSDGNESILVTTPSYALTVSKIPSYRGTNLITYSAADQAGNIGTFVRNVYVKDDMEAATIQQQLDDSYYSTISNDGSRQAIIRKATNDVVIYGVPASSIQLQLSGFGSMEGQMVKLSSNGQIIAFTAPDGVRVYAGGVERLAAVSRFTKSGSSVYHIELSNDGDTIAVSYPGGNAQYLEEVVIFRWNSTQYVEDHSIASAAVTGLGDTISLSSNGNRIALGSSKFGGGLGSNISSTKYSFATPSPTLDGVKNWYGRSERGYQLTRYGIGGANNTMYWPVTLGASWSVSWDWYIYGPRWGGADDLRLIYFATNPITAYEASVHNGYNNFYEFWQGDTHQIRDNNDVYKKSANVYYPLYRWLTVEVSYDSGVMTSTVKHDTRVISSITHNFGAAHQNLYGTQTYFGFSGRTGGVSSSQYIRNINLKTLQDKVGQIKVHDRIGANSWSQVGADIEGGLENQGLGKNVKLSGDGSTLLNKNEGLDANEQNVSVYTLNSGTWTKNSTLIDNLNTRTLLTGNTHELIDISDDGSLLIYSKGTGSEKYVSHPSGLSTKYIDGYKLESGVYKHSLTIPESSSSPTKLVQVTGDGSKVLLHTDNDIVLHSVTDTVFNPVITLTHQNDSDILRVVTYTEQGATSNVTDGSSVVVGGDTGINTPGTYRVRYSVTDSITGKSAHRSRTVVII